MIETAICILHYENEDLTNQCIDSIIDTTDKGTYVIVVIDNASPTVYKRDDVIVIRNSDNGSVSGMNFGFNHVLLNMMDIKYIVNFDNDIICLDNWLPPLIEAMESNSRIGIIGGKQWDYFMENYRSVGMDLVGGKLYGNFPVERSTAIWIQGSFVMLRAKMMREIGLHDTRFHTVCSDSDYCIHANDRGWIVAFEPESNVIHIGGSSYGGSCESGNDDNRKLMQKWFGLKFNQLAKYFPLDAATKKHGQVKFSIVDINEVERTTND